MRKHQIKQLLNKCKIIFDYTEFFISELITFLKIEYKLSDFFLSKGYEIQTQKTLQMFRYLNEI